MTKITSRIITCIVCMSMLCLSGCTHTSHLIAYSVYPIGYLLERIAGSTITAESVQTDTMVQVSTPADDFDEIMAEAECYMHIGDLEPYEDVEEEAMDSVKDTLDLSSAGAVYDFARYTTTADGDTEETAYYEEDVFDDLDVCEKEQAFWLDPIAMLSMGRLITEWLVEKYPDHADYYESNMDALADELIDLDAEYQSLASSLEEDGQTIRFVTMSNGFGIWQNAYGLEVYPVVISKYGVLPNDVQLEMIENRIREDGVEYIVYEPNMTDEMSVLFETLEEDLGLTRVELSNLSSLSAQQEEDGRDYMSIMEDNLLVLETMTPGDLKE